jgi:tRNA-specific 2-thiouridylase
VYHVKQTNKIAVALSGGLDSSMALKLLQEAGHEVIGITLRLTDGAMGPAADDAIASAAAVCDHLGVKHHVYDLRNSFNEKIIRPFSATYCNGETPSPCIWCNRLIKFGELLEIARGLGCDRLATGHYVRIVQDPDNDIRRIRRGVDPAKDQSYFLFQLNQEQLEAAVFPLGNRIKCELRKSAADAGLPIAHRPESNDLCFVADGQFASLVREHYPELPGNGDILDLHGSVLGRHHGYYQYTVGQRRGLGLGGGPWYVVETVPENNTVLVGRRDDVMRSDARVRDFHWTADIQPQKTDALLVQLRHSMKPVPCKIELGSDSTAMIHLQHSVQAAAPGQAAVVYLDDVVVGGGWIVA